MAPFTSDPGHEVAPERVKEMLDRGEIVLIDVREQYEWDAGRIAGAKHIELERLAARADEIPRDRPVVFQCRLGARSAMATEAFRASGYEAYNLTGGISAWVDHGLPLDPDGGVVAEH
ncbi:MAG TPA: rhodanese-like domain-containing protein [Thermoleophilaceae bacterium]|jgi:rhodanese-related sulfurtransferase